MLARIIAACIVGVVLGILMSMYPVINYFVFALAYLVVGIVFTIWLLKWYILSVAIIAIFIMKMSKRNTGE